MGFLLLLLLLLMSKDNYKQIAQLKKKLQKSKYKATNPREIFKSEKEIKIVASEIGYSDLW
jgi:hypothetical protein